MSLYRLSREAERDIERIAAFSADRWGWGRAETYLADLHAAFELIADHPRLGRAIDHIRPGYRRFEHASHSVFYVVAPHGITISRVLHRNMLAEGRI